LIGGKTQTNQKGVFELEQRVKNPKGQLWGKNTMLGRGKEGKGWIRGIQKTTPKSFQKTMPKQNSEDKNKQITTW